MKKEMYVVTYNNFVGRSYYSSYNRIFSCGLGCNFMRANISDWNFSSQCGPVIALVSHQATSNWRMTDGQCARTPFLAILRLN